MASKNFHCYRNIFAIDPGYSFRNGTGFAIFDEESLILKKCGLIKPFAPGLDSQEATIEVADKVRKLWENEVGFSKDPALLCIEVPITCFSFGNGKVNSKSIIMLAILATRIEERFSAGITLRPYPQEWKNKLSKEETTKLILNRLCAWSKKNLNRDLESVPKHLHHNVYDAIGLGLWSITQIKNKKF